MRSRGKEPEKSIDLGANWQRSRLERGSDVGRDKGNNPGGKNADPIPLTGGPQGRHLYPTGGDSLHLRSLHA